MGSIITTLVGNVRSGAGLGGETMDKRNKASGQVTGHPSAAALFSMQGTSAHTQVGMEMFSSLPSTSTQSKQLRRNIIHWSS